MQPYAFPYIGYFNLLEASDKIVFYDDVNYIKRGWINRNRILLNGTDYLFTIPVHKASQNKLIKEIEPKIDDKFLNKFYSQIETAYKKAPFYNETIKIIEQVINRKHQNIADLAIESIVSVYKYLGRDIAWVKSSECSPDTKHLDKADRLITIAKDMGCEHYINALGGKELYNKNYFQNKGVKLSFLQPKDIYYRQFGSDFVPNLSIIDVLMFNSSEKVIKMFNEYELK